MDDDEKTVTNNVDEDMASMMLAAGMWHLEHAHFVSMVFWKLTSYMYQGINFSVFFNKGYLM